MLWGGWTCPNCGCDVDRHGMERNHAEEVVCRRERIGTRSLLDDVLSTEHTFRDVIHRPYLLILEPQIFLAKPWLVVILFGLTGLLLGFAGAIQQGATGGIGGIIGRCLGLGFVGFVIASVCGGIFAAILWLVRSVLKTFVHATRE